MYKLCFAYNIAAQAAQRNIFLAAVQLLLSGLCRKHHFLLLHAGRCTVTYFAVTA
jgi:hypothetical protein